MLVETRSELAGKAVTMVFARDVGQVRDVLRIEDEAEQVYPSIADAIAAMTDPGPDAPGATSSPAPTR
jgi:hypothetical protein